jgi:hypothetical protein
MRRILRGAALVLLTVFVMPVFGADEAKDAKKDDPKDVKKDDVKKDDPKDVKKDDAKKDAPKDAPKDAKKDDPKKDDPKKDDPKKDDPKKDPPKDPKKDDPKKDDPKKDPPKEVKKEEPKKDNGMVKVAEVYATVMNIDESKKSLRLKIEVPAPDLQGVQQGLIDLQNASIKRPPDVNGILAAQTKIAKAQAKTAPVEVEATTTDDVLVRLHEPLPQFDDKGKIKKLTAKEKAELKGDPKLPGYKGEFSDIKTNQIVKVTLVRNKHAPKIKLDPKNKDIDPALLAESKPHISMIIVGAMKAQ